MQMTDALTTRETTALVHQLRPMYYRFHEQLYRNSKLMLVLSSFLLLKTTPTGAWIDDFGRRRFVKTKARKRYACPTIDEALASYHARKDRQVSILQYQLSKAQAARTLQRDGETVYFYEGGELT